jgi:hypothetical protein
MARKCRSRHRHVPIRLIFEPCSLMPAISPFWLKKIAYTSLLPRCGRERLRGAGVEDDDARSDAEFETPAVGEILNGGFGYEEEGGSLGRRLYFADLSSEIASA